MAVLAAINMQWQLAAYWSRMIRMRSGNLLPRSRLGLLFVFFTAVLMIVAGAGAFGLSFWPFIPVGIIWALAVGTLLVMNRSANSHKR